jgi:PAS domain S-box-containing protein
MGLQRQEMVGRIVWDLFPQQNTQFESGCRRAMNERVTVQFEEYRASLHTWFEDTVYPSTDGIIVFVHDITKRMRASEALRASNERFQRYFELGLIGMAITSPSKGCIEVNDHICEILGYERSELLAMTWADLTHPDDLAADVEHFNRVMAGDIDGYSIDKRWVRKDGQVIPTRISVKCIRLTDASVDSGVGIDQELWTGSSSRSSPPKLAESEWAYR